MRLNPPRSLLSGLTVAALVAIADQLSKSWALHLIEARRGPSSVLPFFDVTLVMNRGVSFGFLAGFDAKRLLVLFTLGMIALLLFWLSRARGRIVPGALALVLGGATGNLLDRLRLGAVIDFLDFHLGIHHWPAFNLADSAIVVGVALLLLDSFFLSGRQGRPAT